MYDAQKMSIIYINVNSHLVIEQKHHVHLKNYGFSSFEKTS